MKVKLHIAIDSYEFAEVEVDEEEADTVYSRIKERFADKEGLVTKEWNKALETYLSTNELESDTYERMSAKQKGLIQEIKRAVKRINYKNND